MNQETVVGDNVNVQEEEILYSPCKTWLNFGLLFLVKWKLTGESEQWI